MSVELIKHDVHRTRSFLPLEMQGPESEPFLSTLGDILNVYKSLNHVLD